MAFDYDTLYGQQSDALGAPTPRIVEIFEQLEFKRPNYGQTLLDIGCGQGRDAVFLADMGYKVTAIDPSPNGIAALRAKDRSIHAVVTTLEDYSPDQRFDVVLADRTLHILHRERMLKQFERIVDWVKPEGALIVADEPRNVSEFASRLLSQRFDLWLHDKGYLATSPR